MKPKFQPDIDLDVTARPPAMLIDPEAFDASEQQFAASVEEEPARPQFIVDASGVFEAAEGKTKAHGENAGSAESETSPNCSSSETGFSGKAEEQVVRAESPQIELPEPEDSGSWRNEVAARVNHYRARRRPRTPHYPSLQLKFDPPEPLRVPQSGPTPPLRSSRLAVAMQAAQPVPREPQAESDTTANRWDESETGAKIIEFPRSAVAPPLLFDELADPVVDRPRILEAPELLPPPPALGGILIEPVEESEKERRRGFELPLEAAPMSRRLRAGAIDGLVVITAIVLFAYIFLRTTSIVPPLPLAAETAVALTALFWIAYQYLLLVYTGTTPGLKLSKLRLSCFDGAAVPRRVRRWRVLASVLSGMSLTLGYAWCFLDEDRLCWHDRITRTYMAPLAASEDSASPL